MLPQNTSIPAQVLGTDQPQHESLNPVRDVESSEPLMGKTDGPEDLQPHGALSLVHSSHPACCRQSEDAREECITSLCAEVRP